MSVYPADLSKRFASQLAALRRDVTKLKTRTAGIDSGATLAVLPATIDPDYATGDPKAYINGAAVLTGPYNHLASYTPAAGDQVLVVPAPVTQSVLTGYVILGKIA